MDNVAKKDFLFKEIEVIMLENLNRVTGNVYRSGDYSSFIKGGIDNRNVYNFVNVLKAIEEKKA